jgi:hypothetical protein
MKKKKTLFEQICSTPKHVIEIGRKFRFTEIASTFGDMEEQRREELLQKIFPDVHYYDAEVDYESNGTDTRMDRIKDICEHKFKYIIHVEESELCPYSHYELHDNIKDIYKYTSFGAENIIGVFVFNKTKNKYGKLDYVINNKVCFKMKKSKGE